MMRSCSSFLHHSEASLICVSGQTPGGDVEAAGQSGGSHGHSGREARLAGGRRRRRWRVRGKFEGQQSPARATPSPGGKVDCMVHFLPFLSTFPVHCVLSFQP